MKRPLTGWCFPLYDFLNRMPGPQRTGHKMLLLALLGVLVPLFTLMLSLVLAGSSGISGGMLILLVALGTLVGMGIVLLAVQALLTPINAVGKALEAFDRNSGLPRFGITGLGEVDELTEGTGSALMELRQSIEHLEACAQLDVLTRLLNRRGARERLARMIDVEQEHRRPILLLFIDIDRFRRINAMYGRAVGDRVLQQVGCVLRASLRERDWVARWDEDEFLLVLANNDRQDVEALAERLREQLHALPVDEEGRLVVDVGFSAGAAYLLPGMSVEELVERADAAQVEAKKNPEMLCFVAGEVSV